MRTGPHPALEGVPRRPWDADCANAASPTAHQQATRATGAHRAGARRVLQCVKVGARFFLCLQTAAAGHPGSA
jgi:hypothetical protein